MNGDPRPSVAMPRDALPMPVMLGVLAALGVGLFLFLNGHRRTPQAPQAALAPLQAAPPLAPPPPEAPPAPVVLREVVQGPVRMAPAPPPQIIRVPMPMAESRAVPPRAANRDGALVIDLTAGSAPAVQGSRGAEGAPNAAALASNDEAARATLIRNRASVIPQGTVIAAVLETPLNSDRPGLARALVAQDARGFDGSRVLIPRGSRLIGEFRMDAMPGKRRVLVTWNRLIRPDGVAIRIASPAADALGGAGIAGAVNTHWAERFASAVLQSALAVGVNVASAEMARSNSAVYLGLTGQSSGLGQQLAPNTNRPATVKVKEGAQIAVLVARDLDFGGTPAIR